MPKYLVGAAYATFLADEMKRWPPIVKASGVQPSIGTATSADTSGTGMMEHDMAEPFACGCRLRRRRPLPGTRLRRRSIPTGAIKADRGRSSRLAGGPCWASRHHAAAWRRLGQTVVVENRPGRRGPSPPRKLSLPARPDVYTSS